MMRAQTPDLREASSSSSTPKLAAADGAASRDNIKVSVRIRPLSDKESGRGDRAVWGADGSGGVGILSAAGDRLDVKFAYDVVFSAGNTNQQVFEQVAWPAIEPVLQGVSGTVFAYGVTSSGKTHTMMGTPADTGVVPRAIQVLFERIDAAQDSVFSVRLSMMEIYCEMLNDLLDSRKLNLDVQECQGGAGKGSVLVVKGLTEGQVASAAEALALIQQGQENRKVASTAYNDQSSRSHTICRLLVESSPRQRSSADVQAAAAAAGGAVGSFSAGAAGSGSGGGGGGSVTCTSAWLTLVDLAGSEGAKAALSKDQQAEARDINRSLLTLGKVMYELAKGSSGGHLPFRDSLLTRLLKPSLTGTGAKVAIICNVTPASSQSDETWNTLRFADGAKRIKVTAVKNEALDIVAVVAQYQREVAALKAQLAALSGAAACAGGSLCPDVLQAIQVTLDNSSKDNAADQAKDSAAQLQYLRECLSFASEERDQLLVINRKLAAMLVQHTRQAAAAAAGTAAAAAAEDGPSEGGGLGEASCSRAHGADAAAGSGGLAGRRAAGLRRSLSYESLEYYAQWQGSGSGTHQQQQQPPRQHHTALDLTAGLECNTADAVEVQELLRISGDELPECITHGSQQQAFQQRLQQQDQEQQQQQAELPAPQSTKGQAAAYSGVGGLSRPISGSSNLSTKGGLLGLRPESAVGIPPVLSKYYSALSSFTGLSTLTDSSNGGSSVAAGGGGPAAAVMQLPIVFSGSRRTSKTLAVAVPGEGVAGAVVNHPAGWLGCVGLPVLPEAVANTALWRVVEAHKTLAAQEGRLDLLLQQLADKEALLDQARQLQQGQVLQLRLTITAADRALLRDKLAEAEQQIASYKAQQAENEQDIQDMFTHINHLQQAVSSQQAGDHRHGQQQDRVALAAQLALTALPAAAEAPQQEPQGPAAAAAAAAAAAGATGAGLSAQRSLSRCSSGRSSPEPNAAGGTRIPAAPFSPRRNVATVGGGSSTPPASSRVAAGSFSRSVGSPPRKSAAASATFAGIKSALLAAGPLGGGAGSSSTSPVNSGRSGSCPTAAAAAGTVPLPPAAAAAAGGGGIGSSMSPQLSKLASKLPGIHVVDDGGSCSPVRRTGSPCGSPLSMSRSNSFLAGRAASASPFSAGVLPAGPGALSASFSGPPSKERAGLAAGAGPREREALRASWDSKLRASWNSSGSEVAQQAAGAGQAATASGFNPICISSPFNSVDQMIAAGRGFRATGDRGSSGTGEPGSPGGAQQQQQLRSSAEGLFTGGSERSTSSLLQSSKQSRIPLPPFLKRQSSRLLQLHRGGDGSSDSGNGNGSAGNGSAQPVLDRFLLGLHGPGALPHMQEEAAQQVGGSERGPKAPLQQGTSPFSMGASAAAAAVRDSVAEEHPGDGEGAEGDGLGGSGGEMLLPVKSHPVELRASVVEDWSTRSSMCL